MNSLICPPWTGKEAKQDEVDDEDGKSLHWVFELRLVRKQHAHSPSGNEAEDVWAHVCRHDFRRAGGMCGGRRGATNGYLETFRRVEKNCLLTSP